MIFRKNKYKKITVGRLTQFCTFMTIPYYVVQEHVLCNNMFLNL